MSSSDSSSDSNSSSDGESNSGTSSSDNDGFCEFKTPEVTRKGGQSTSKKGAAISTPKTIGVKGARKKLVVSTVSGKGAQKQLVVPKDTAAGTAARKKKKNKTRKLTKVEIKQICKHIDENVDTLLDNIQKSVIQIKGKYLTSINLTLLVKHAQFGELVKVVTQDFTTAYSDRGSLKYEDFQLRLFNGIHDYLYKSGEKQQLVSALFPGIDQEMIVCTFPSIYHNICNVLHREIVQYLAIGKLQHDTHSQQCELDIENEAQLYRMHGWALFELHKKSTFKDTVQYFILPKEEKESLPQYKVALTYLDVGTKTGLTFPKKTFLDFMRTSDTFIREQITDEKFLIYGSNVIAVAKTMVHNNVQLQTLFAEGAALCCNCDKETIQAIYKAWIEKYLNMKMKGRFTDAIERLDVDKSKRITTKTQNLRDGLYTNHVGSSTNK